VGLKTICDSGDKLTALAMILDGCKIKVDSDQANPRTLNKWLAGHSGFLRKENDEVEIVVGEMAKFGFNAIGRVEGEMGIRSMFRKGAQVVLKIHDGAGPRTVVLRGFTSQTFIVGDPTPLGSMSVSPADVHYGETFFHPRCRSVYLDLDE